MIKLLSNVGVKGGSYTSAVVLTSQSTARVGPGEKGTLLGVEHGGALQLEGGPPC